MADDDTVESTIRLRVDDPDSARVFRQFGDNAQAATRAAQQSVADVGKAFGDAERAAASFFGKFVSFAAVAEFARRSFLNFAEVQRGSAGAGISKMKGCISGTSRQRTSAWDELGVKSTVG
jgi:hypothetical protein